MLWTDNKLELSDKIRSLHVLVSKRFNELKTIIFKNNVVKTLKIRKIITAVSNVLRHINNKTFKYNYAMVLQHY